MCTERKATGLFVLTSFLCDNGWEVFSVPVFTNIIQDTVRELKKKHSQRKLQILNADFSPQF